MTVETNPTNESDFSWDDLHPGLRAQMTAQGDIAWDQLADDQQARLSVLVHKYWPDVEPADYWRDMGLGARRDWLWHDEHGDEPVDTWSEDEARAADAADADTAAAFTDRVREKVSALISRTNEAFRTFTGRFGYSDDDYDDGRSLVAIRADTIPLRAVDWRWEGRVPAGEITLLAGREGIGKSTCSTEIAASITKGTLPGDMHGTPGNVLMVAPEDSWEHTMGPRLVAAGADLTRVYKIAVARVDIITSEQLTLPLDLDRLRQMIEELDISLVVFDPLISQLGASLDAHKDPEVRQALEPLKEIAENTQTPFLGLIHLNKSGGTDPLNQIMASRAFTAVPRSVLFAMTSPDDEGTYLLGNPKNNLGPQAITLIYGITGYHVTDTPEGKEIWTSKITWHGETVLSIIDALAEAESAGKKSKMDEAKDWLKGYLTAAGGGAERADVEKAAKDTEHSWRTIQRARESLKVTIEGIPGSFPARTHWVLPIDSVGTRAHVPNPSSEGKSK